VSRASSIAIVIACLHLLQPTAGLAAVPQDTTRVDSLAAEEAPPDSSLRRAQVLPITEAETPTGPLAPGTRYRFTRTSMVWTSALTLSDLLTAIPGVYVARGGFFGQPEFVMYAGRGAASLELYWDGLPMHPLGADSVYIDPGRFSLSYLKQVDVEVLPGALRVYLVSERHERPDPRSVIRITSGAFSTAQYAGLFQRRWSSGLGLNLAGDFMASDGDVEVSRNDQYLDLWAKLEWLPGAGTAGAVYQIRRQSQERDARGGDGTLGVPERNGDRTEFLFKVFSGNRPDRLGILAEAGLGSTSWGGDSIVGDQSIRQAFASVRYRAPQLSIEALGRMADGRVRAEMEGRVGWVPVRGVVISGSGRWQRFTGNRTARRGTVSLGLSRGPLSAVGQLSQGDVVQAPALTEDSAQQVTDASVFLGLDTRRLRGHVGLARRGAFLPAPLPDLPSFPGMDSSKTATYLVADLQFRPVHPVFLTAWYSHPRTTPADFQPPEHGRVDLTFRSKFWRTFRSGAFEFLLRYGVEYWSTGTAGLDGAGSPVVLPGATFHEWFVELELVGFKAFWNLRNARNSRGQFVPSLSYPRNAQTFGVRWEFFN
jgi:hypothetical protein